MAVACTRFIDSEVERCKRECGQGSVTGTPGRADLWASSLSQETSYPPRVEHIFIYVFFILFFKLKCCLIFSLFIKKNLSSFSTKTNTSAVSYLLRAFPFPTGEEISSHHMVCKHMPGAMSMQTCPQARQTWSFAVFIPTSLLG